MTRELAAGALLLLLMAGAWWNIHAVDTLTGEIMADLDASQAAEEQGNHPAARAALDKALNRWLEADSYTHIFIRHAEIDAITDDFYDLLSHLCAQADEARGGYEHLLTAVRRLAEMETPSLGSIF